MTAKSKLLLIFGIFFAGAFVLIIGSAFFTIFILPMWAGNRAVELNKKRSAETVGTFTYVNVQRRRLEKTGGGGTSYTYYYKYTVNDVLYEGDQSTSGGITNEEQKNGGVKVKVCYDPSNPKSSEFYSLNDNKTCGK